MQDNKSNSFSFIAEVSGDVEQLMNTNHEGRFPLLVVRDILLFPGVVLPIHVGRKESVRVLQRAEKQDLMVAVFTQKDASIEVPEKEDILPYGVVAKLVHFIEMPDGEYSALMQGFNRVSLQNVYKTRSGRECDVLNAPEVLPVDAEEHNTYNVTLSILKENLMRLGDLSEGLPTELLRNVRKIEPSPYMVNFMAGSLPIDVQERFNLLAADSRIGRAMDTLRIVKKLISFSVIRRRIEQKTQNDLNRQQHEYFINQQIRNLQAELGSKDEMTIKNEDCEALRREGEEAKWNDETRKIFERELSKLERMNMQSPDYNMQLNYLQTLVGLPWGKYTTAQINIKHAQARLDKDHYGLEVVKERILEHLAVLKLHSNRKSPIICLYGPPGVGKTSLCRSIADALKRKYVRISLGGMHDESEIRGHRRTYIGAMPGRIIKGLQKAGSANPVFILDEIDKVVQGNVHGDPSSALLEVLDPDQNNAFHDNFIDVDFDLSQVMFIATANDLSTIPSPLLDRMELIEVTGYMTEEKIEIARRHLIPKKKDDNGLAQYKNIKVGKPAIEFIAERYTRESGVRSLEKQIDKLMRKVALKVASGELGDTLSITPKEVESYLGKPRFSRDQYQGNDFAGVVTGLAWTSVGGEILFIETSISKGKAGSLTLTGNLGDVMKESAMLACEYIRSHASKWNIDPRIFDHYSMHIHVPEGAVPKDGPSAGVTMATSIVSALTQRKVREHLAMTGEITLRGKVLPVGGIKEKILAARRAGITQIVLCHENRKDIEEIPAAYLTGMHFQYVHTIADVLDFALLDEKVRDAVQFEIPEEKK